MESHETPMIMRLWEQIGGMMFKEFQVVNRSDTQERRCIDAIILPDRERREVYSPPSLKGQNVIVVQAKAYRLGMALMGQTLFSTLLVEQFNRPSSVRGIALAGADDTNLGPLLRTYSNLSLWIDHQSNNTKEPSLITPDTNQIIAYWQKIGGTLIENYPLTDKTPTAAAYAAHAVILPKAETIRLRNVRLPLEGKDAIIVHSTPRRLDMYTLGKVVFATELIKQQRPKFVRSTALCSANDSALSPLLSRFRHIEVVPNHY